MQTIKVDVNILRGFFANVIFICQWEKHFFLNPIGSHLQKYETDLIYLTFKIILHQLSIIS